MKAGSFFPGTHYSSLYAMAGDDWLEISAGLTATAELLIDAAERKDSEAIFNLGGTLYNVCVSCHQLYVVPETAQLPAD